MAGMMDAHKERLRISLHGDVQGFGFRPTVYRIADSLRLSGWVRNTTDGIEIEIEGNAELLNIFLTQLKANQPRLAVVTSEEVLRIEPTGSPRFEIIAESH